MHITKTFFLYSISDIDKELPYRLTETQKKATVSRYYITFEGKRYVYCYRSVMKRREGCGRDASAAPTDGSGASQAKLDGHRPGTHTPTATLPTSNPFNIYPLVPHTQSQPNDAHHANHKGSLSPAHFSSSSAAPVIRLYIRPFFFITLIN